jgi:hypothetical protein
MSRVFGTLKKKLSGKETKTMEKTTKELGEVLKFVCALGNAIGEAAKDGEISLGDATHLIPLLYRLPAAVDGMADIAAEVKDMSQDEMDALIAMVKEELDLPQDQIEVAVEEALDIAIKLYALVAKLRA